MQAVAPGEAGIYRAQEYVRFSTQATQSLSST